MEATIKKAISRQLEMASLVQGINPLIPMATQVECYATKRRMVMLASREVFSFFWIQKIPGV